MSDPVEVDPEGLRRAADEFEDIADRTRSILDTLRGNAESKGEPWGHDKTGKQFAEGEKGYLAGRDNTFDSLKNLVTVFDDNATNLRDSATQFENADEW
ncbi:WXG100 family type VII secretion target [Nocardia sp. BMG51109]|uniref:WXG100 family type VII secretion target n=1 Tax=Nocardia sp. BMG51109 TaxID=1056816 RepID=UPI000466CBCC|nr:WXG100 family type VII secretion target [Nocardia sp. BMG51109]